MQAVLQLPPDQPLPPIEALFTVDEESTFSGEAPCAHTRGCSSQLTAETITGQAGWCMRRTPPAFPLCPPCTAGQAGCRHCRMCNEGRVGSFVPAGLSALLARY